MLDLGMLPVPFSVATAVVSVGGGVFTAQVSADWTLRGKPNGGYLVAMMARAASTGREPECVTAVSAHFLGAPDPGPVSISVELLREGRSGSQLRLRLMQTGRCCVEALATTGWLRPSAEPYWSARVAEPTLTSRENCVRVAPVMPDGGPALLMGQVDLRLDPAVAGFLSGLPSGDGEIFGWLSLPGEEPFDPISLMFAVDACPPATFNVQVTSWVPTVELTAYVRALPAPGPVRVLQRAQLIEDQRVDETCQVRDSIGRVVAQATQLAAIRLGRTRNRAGEVDEETVSTTEITGRH